MGELNACCGYAFDDLDADEASGIDCLHGLSCDDCRSEKGHDTVPTCRPGRYSGTEDVPFAKKGSCNINTGESADILIIYKHCSVIRCHD